MTTKTQMLMTLFVASATAFSTNNKPAAFVVQTTTTSLESTVSRAHFMNVLASSAAAATVAWTVGASPASAARYGGIGRGSSEVLNPTDAVVDSSVLRSDVMQKAIANTKRYQAAVQSLQTALEQQPQANLIPFIRKEFDFVALRGDLNTLNLPLDEDTQRGTDRIIRIILQDITELESASLQKEGIPRSDRRLEAVKGKLTKLNQAFADILAFATTGV